MSVTGRSAGSWSPDGKSFVAADDAEVVGIKTRWARDNGYRGVFCWRVGNDMMLDGTPPPVASFRVSP